MKTEPVRLADGLAFQGLLDGVPPLDQTRADLARLNRERDARRGNAPPPAGGLFDDCARAQRSLF